MFQPRQLVCWDAGDRRLYAEVIQSIPARARCWVRPLLLAMSADSGDVAQCQDLRTAPDLVWSASAFRLALDTEAIPLLALLPPTPTNDAQARRWLNQFLRQTWVRSAPH
ncbi:MAG: hypothetical protein HC838_04195 [Spirulinaceae cyanobacterium RM2_2_10]|nr:hypothetical protein [Spirulinaceae cyanobacterium SM2_1_0]NJO19424.1 hypothetical protein [Spirulinaceae cyanobacterium RM2_2_10]